MDDRVSIALLAADEVVAVVPELADVLLDGVADGASIGFLADLDLDRARTWWHGAVGSPGTLTWVARLDGRVVGVVQLKLVTYPNGRHRADVAKLLVHRRARGLGLSRALMAALESEARRRGRWLLLLDTETGSLAEQLYEKWGWQRLGVLADHAAVPDGELRPTTFFSKRLLSGPPPS